jgi:membrane associated rhomboid family serine protease
VTPVVRTLLIATVGAFFLQSTAPALTDYLVFYPALSMVLTHPWTLVSYMFLHAGLTHLLFNMLALFFFGPRVEDRIGSRPFAILYFISGISGALLSLVLGGGSPIVGASGGVFGVSLAFAYFWPHEPILIWGVLPVPARMLVIITGVISLWSGFSGAGGNVAHFAHLGGYAGAFLYLKWLERARTGFKRVATAAPPAATRRIATGYQNIDRGSIHEVNRAEVDRILDKIGASGIDALTPQERLFLSNFVPMDDRKPPVS